MLKGNFFKTNPGTNYDSSKVPKLYFQSQFSMYKIDIFFLTSIFEPLYFLKSCPICDKLALPVLSKYKQWFPLSLLIFGQKSCFLGPTMFKIPQPNWHFYTSTIFVGNSYRISSRIPQTTGKVEICKIRCLLDFNTYSLYCYVSTFPAKILPEKKANSSRIPIVWNYNHSLIL